MTVATNLMLLLATVVCAQIQLGQTSKVPAPQSVALAEAPTVEQIIDHYGKAVGGRAAWQKLTSRSSMGTVEVPAMNLSGTVVIHEKAPNKILTIIIIAGSAYRQGFDGAVGWAEDPQDGLREQAGPELAEAKRQSDFYGPFDLHEHYAKLVFLGSEKVRDREAYVVEATPAEGGEPDKMYFDTQSGLPVRLVSQHHTPDGVLQFREEFSITGKLTASDCRSLSGRKATVRHSHLGSAKCAITSLLRMANLPSLLYNKTYRCFN